MNIFLWIMIAFLIIVFLKTVVFGAHLWDKLLGMSVISAKVILVVIFYASMNDSAYLLDFAIIYALFGFIGTIFIALFLSERGRKGKE